LRQVDVVGVGALNVDCIASASRLSQRMAEQVGESAAGFQRNTEGPVDEVTVAKAIEHPGSASLDASLGGFGVADGLHHRAAARCTDKTLRPSPMKRHEGLQATGVGCRPLRETTSDSAGDDLDSGADPPRSQSSVGAPARLRSRRPRDRRNGSMRRPGSRRATRDTVMCRSREAVWRMDWTQAGAHTGSRTSAADAPLWGAGDAGSRWAHRRARPQGSDCTAACPARRGARSSSTASRLCAPGAPASGPANRTGCAIQRRKP